MVRIISAVFLAILLSGATCERPVELEVELPAPELVVISTFSPGLPFAVSVSSTRSALVPSLTDYPEDAEVSLFRGEEFLEKLRRVTGTSSTAPFFQSTENYPLAGEIYSLQVSAPGFRPVTAQSVIPRPVSIRDIEAVHTGFSPVADPGEAVHHYRITVTFDDPGAFHNFYHLRFQQELLEYVISEAGDTLITGKTLNHIAFGQAINNNTITAYLEDGVLFEDESFNGRRVSFSFPMQTRVVQGREMLGHLYVELRTVSDDYYRFYSTVGRQQDNPGPPFSEPVIVFTNVEDGRGIFAGYNAALDSVRVRW